MAGNKRSQSPSKSKLKLPKPFDWTDDLMTATFKRAFGHVKAGSLLARVVAGAYGRGPAMQFLNHLSNMGFYGEDIYYGYESYCRSDLEFFKACVELEDKTFCDFILDWKAQNALRALKGNNV